MAKYSAFGTKFSRVTAPAADLAQVMSITGPGLALDTVDVTSHDSPGGWEEVVGTILRSGEISMDLVYDPTHATHRNLAGGLIYILTSKTAAVYSLTFPDAGLTVWQFTALCTRFEVSAAVDGALTASVTFKVTGQPTLA